MSRPKPIMLLILDGWGYREGRRDNAMALATKTPNWTRLWNECPHTLIHTSGLRVGTPIAQRSAPKNGRKRTRTHSCSA